jgi:hypothetical protein
MTIKVENNLPKFYIVSDTKINPQTLEKYLEESGKSHILKEWLENNPEAAKISSLEKHLEITGRTFGLYPELKATNAGYMKEILKNPYSQFLFQQANVNIFFENVSINFLFLVMRLQIENLSLINEKITLDKLGFWLPPMMDQPSQKDAALNFGLACTGLAQKLEELMTFYQFHVLEKENAHLAEKIRSNIMRLLPVSTQFNLGINTSISSWRQLLIRASDFLSEDEMRYIFLNLAREFKTRYYSLFQDCVLEDIAGKQLGLDSLRTEDKAWYKYKLRFKLEG